VKIAYWVEEKKPPPALSNLDAKLLDEGIQGAALGIRDNNTTGLFSGHEYQLKLFTVKEGTEVRAKFAELLAEKYRYIVTHVSAQTLIKLSALANEHDIVLFNVSAEEDELRNSLCATNIFHVIPSYAMRTDALAQFMLKKRWQKWFLVTGASEQDRLFAIALKRSAKRFGIKIIQQKNWTFDHDSRRTAQAEIPSFTQVGDYDVLIVADVLGMFGEYMAFNTWLPRPIAGTQGLVPTAWHRLHERWGGVQLQNRFYKQAERSMNAIDYASWLAVRSVAEAITRLQVNDLKRVKKFILDEHFSLAGFKGTRLSFRPWNQQLRQPVLLATERSVVATLPSREFLHPHNYLDTLGYDQSESSCYLN